MFNYGAVREAWFRKAAVAVTSAQYAYDIARLGSGVGSVYDLYMHIRGRKKMIIEERRQEEYY